MALSAVGDRPKAVSRAAAKQPTLALTDLLDLGFIQHDAVDCNAVAEHVAEDTPSFTVHSPPLVALSVAAAFACSTIP